MFDLLSPALPLEGAAEAAAQWIGALPAPCALAVRANSAGLRTSLVAAPGTTRGARAGWASLTRQHSRWQPAAWKPPLAGSFYALSSPALLPSLAAGWGDPFVSLGGALLSSASNERPLTLFAWIYGREDRLQERLRTLFAYATGTEKGVEDDTPNPWSLRLGLSRFVLFAGGLLAAGAGAALAAGWMPPGPGALAVASGGILSLAGGIAALRWMQMRSLPQEIVRPRLSGPLLRVGFMLHGRPPGDLPLLAGEQRWRRVTRFWPDGRRCTFPLPAGDLARLFAPLESSDAAGLYAREAVQDVPAPPPSPSLREAPLQIGRSVVTGEAVGIESSGHLLVSGGSRTGKSSAVFGLLRSLLADPKAGPGLFLLDPHGTLADAFLGAIDQLPGPARAAAVERLRVLDPGSGAVVPLNLLAVPDFNWAGNALVLAGRRIWGEYWGPRMQAALLALARLGHRWNLSRESGKMGLGHLVFAAFDPEWRRTAAGALAPEERLGSAALDALLGQQPGRAGAARAQWATEVISPIVSKIMSLELSPWLFQALHADGFADLESWVRSSAWVVLRLPTGDLGREGARLAAGVVYNVFEAAFRRVTASGPVPTLFVLDEIQEAGSALELGSLLSEGGKFGAQLLVLAQSLSLLRRLEGFEPVVQALLANTSAQLFFSPDPEDAELMRAVLSAESRYGPTSIDVPSLQGWLRARIAGRWQPPALVAVDPLPAPEPAAVRRVLRDVIDAHPADYVSGKVDPVAALHAMQAAEDTREKPTSSDARQLGW